MNGNRPLGAPGASTGGRDPKGGARQRLRYAVALLLAAVLAPAALCAQTGAPSEAETRPLSIVEYVIPAKHAFPSGVAVARGGTVWYTDQANSRIGRLDPETGQFEDYPTPKPDAGPQGILVRQRMVWFTESRRGRIGRFDPAAGKFEEFRLAGVARDPHSLAYSRGKLWFTVPDANMYGYLDLQTGESKVLPVRTPDARPFDIARAPDGYLWATLSGTNALLRIDPQDASYKEIALPAPGARPRRIAVDRNGVVWYTDFARSRLGRYDPNRRRFSAFPTVTPDSGPRGLAVGTDGRVWYNEAVSNLVVGFDPHTRKSLTLEIPTVGAIVRRITVDRVRRRLWLGLSGTRRLGRIDLR